MLKLTMDDKKVEKIGKIYEQERYRYSNREPFQTLFETLRVGIEAEINRQNRTGNARLTDAERIVGHFLRKCFTDTIEGAKNWTTKDYLKEENISSIIELFWGCVVEVWLEKLSVSGIVTAPYLTHVSVERIAGKLSKWNGIKQWAVKLNGEKIPEDMDDATAMSVCSSCIFDTITTETAPFFEIPRGQVFYADTEQEKLKNTLAKQMKNAKPFEGVHFRYGTDLYGRKATGGLPGITGALEILGRIFDYDLLSGQPRHDILTSLYVPVCPYCNRQYITKYDQVRGGKERTTADLDHFYYQHEYPYLALSVYNFVPSCQICNRTFKKTRDFYGIPHLYPYSQETNAAVKFQLANLKVLLNIQRWSQVEEHEDGFTLEIVPGEGVNGELAERVANSVKAFHLDEVYQSHEDYVYELYLKTRSLDELIHNFGEELGDKEELRKIAFGEFITEEKMENRPLAKLTQDVLAEFKAAAKHLSLNLDNLT